MRKRDLDKFRKILLEQRDELAGKAKRALSGDIHLDPDDFPDEIDTASSEVNLSFQGRLRERERGLLAKIEQALQKIEQGVYGECERLRRGDRRSSASRRARSPSSASTARPSRRSRSVIWIGP